MVTNHTLTGQERTFNDDDIIVSKTNLKGHLTYANKIFLDISGYKEQDVLGKAHNFIRHPDMPRCIFKLLWETLASGNEIFAYINNRAKSGDHYWVYAHVTPSWDDDGKIIGYHSNRRVPDRRILDEHIIPLYKQLKTEESKHSNGKEGMAAGLKMLQNILNDAGIAYDEFMATIGQGRRRGYR